MNVLQNLLNNDGKKQNELPQDQLPNMPQNNEPSLANNNNNQDNENKEQNTVKIE